jgi:hypothetical protein
MPGLISDLGPDSHNAFHLRLINAEPVDPFLDRQRHADSRLVLLEQWGPVVGPLTAIHHKAVIAALER